MHQKKKKDSTQLQFYRFAVAIRWDAKWILAPVLSTGRSASVVSASYGYETFSVFLCSFCPKAINHWLEWRDFFGRRAVIVTISVLCRLEATRHFDRPQIIWLQTFRLTGAEKGVHKKNESTWIHMNIEERRPESSSWFSKLIRWWPTNVSPWRAHADVGLPARFSKVIIFLKTLTLFTRKGDQDLSIWFRFIGD